MQYDSTPLHKASDYGCIDTVKTLISHGANIHAKDKVRKCFTS